MEQFKSVDNLVYTTEFNLYEHYEKKCNSGYVRKCINGKNTSCGNCVGYCRYKGHLGFLTKELRKEHNFINKKCFYYLPKPKKSKEFITRS